MKQIKVHTLKRLFSYLLRYKGMLCLAIFLSIGSNLLALLGPWLSGLAIDQIQLGKGAVNFERIFKICGLMVVFFIFSCVFSYLLSILMLEISKRIAYQLRKSVFEHLLALKIGYFDTHPTGDIISRISYDIDTVNASLSSDLVTVCASLITVIGSFLSMLMISPALVTVFLVMVPLSIFLSTKLSKMMRPMFRNRSRKLGELNGSVEEWITGQKTIKAYNQEENTREKFAEKNKEAADAYYKAEYYGAMVGPTVNFMNNLSLTFISLAGAFMFLHGKISLGNISAFVLYSRKFSGPINESANIMSEFQSAIAAGERIFTLLDEEVEKEDDGTAVSLTNVQGNVELQKVSFGYEKGKTILHDLDLDVKSGDLVAVVGPTGAGKTTLINLLMRFYDVDAGEIQIDGKDIRGVTRGSLRNAYTMVLQDTWLFEGSVYENIAYGIEGATLEQVMEAAKAARMHHYIMQLPNRYDTILTDGGTMISKGQKQLLTIARAMLLDASILILDEATSNVDTRTEIAIQEAMQTLMQGKTCFVIAHRLSTIQNADCILVVKDGNIVEKGNHNELMQSKGFYYDMYRSQFS